jgi:hypothetical protein
MLSNLINRPCSVIRRLASDQTDQYGDEIPVEEVIETVCELQQHQRKEPGAEGELSDTDWIAFFLPGIDIRTGDVLVVDQERYEMVGDPWVARNPRSQNASHIECSARRTVATDDEVGS